MPLFDRHQLFPHLVQVDQRKQQHHLAGVLCQPLEPGLGIAKDAFERVKRMLHPGTDAGLGDFLCSELVLFVVGNWLRSFRVEAPSGFCDGARNDEIAGQARNDDWARAAPSPCACLGR